MPAENDFAPRRHSHTRCGSQETRNAVAETENIVVETAEKIFSDLADAQTINHDKSDAWKVPLWRALTEAGLPRSWVPEDCGGGGAPLPPRCGGPRRA